MGLENATIATRLPVQDLDAARQWYADKLGLYPSEERVGGLLYELGGSEFALYQSAGTADGSFSQMAYTVPDVDATVAELRSRGVVFEEYDFPGMTTHDGIADIDGYYPSKGKGERAAWFRDLDGNMFGVSTIIR